jgi:hypothetical protein
MIITYESGAQEDQFDGKKRRPKISWYYPFKQVFSRLPELIGNRFLTVIFLDCDKMSSCMYTVHYMYKKNKKN